MTSVADMLARMRNNPRDIRFSDAVHVAEAHFGPARRSGSHHVFRMPWPGDPRVNLQQTPNGKAKPYQIRQLLAAIHRLEMTHAREIEDARQQGAREAAGRRGGRRGCD